MNIKEQIENWSMLIERLLKSDFAYEKETAKSLALDNIAYLKKELNDTSTNYPQDLQDALNKRNGKQRGLISIIDKDGLLTAEGCHIWESIYNLSKSYDRGDNEVAKEFIIDIGVDNIITLYAMLPKEMAFEEKIKLIPSNILERIGEKSGRRKK